MSANSNATKVLGLERIAFSKTPKQRLGIQIHFGRGHGTRQGARQLRDDTRGLTGIEKEAQAIDDCTRWSKRWGHCHLPHSDIAGQGLEQQMISWP